jgi:hypothetical protein
MHNAVLAVKLFRTDVYERPSTEGWLEAVEEYWRRREEFVQAARRDLGVEVRSPARPRPTRRGAWRLRLPRIRRRPKRRPERPEEA